MHSDTNSIGDLLDEAASKPAPKKARKKTDPAKKPSKAIVTKPAAKAAKKAVKANGKSPVTKKGAKAAKGEEKPKPKKVVSNLSMQQPEDSVVLKAVRKLKEPMMASKFSAGLEVHRRVIRAQLQRLAKDKDNGVGMKKVGAHWIVENKAK